MEKPTSALFDVFLRLRPSNGRAERFLNVESVSEDSIPTHVTVHPPTGDNRKRAVERFAFTQIFEEQAGQLELFHDTGIVNTIQNVIGRPGQEGRDGILATLGVTGSGKSHTILGSKNERGITQLALDSLFTQLDQHLAAAETSATIFSSLCRAETSEAQLIGAANYLDSITYDVSRASRAATPAMDSSFVSLAPAKRHLPRFSDLPSQPHLPDFETDIDGSAEFAIVMSMYEVYNDRIFDLLVPSASAKAAQKRRALLFKNTELSPDRKVVAGLRKVVCSSYEDAIMVLEAGLHERKVAGTGSNATSSRSHGFINIEVKKRKRTQVPGAWHSSSLTIMDLAGSERARLAGTAGQTLAEAGKINSSLMYLGQCMQMQSDNSTATNPALVPYRQCKLTELLFSNTFATNSHKHQPQKAIMIVTADPLGDFNGTSQILRYSALAKEITVPRIPSTSSTLLAGTSTQLTHTTSSGDLEAAMEMIAKLQAELELADARLMNEHERRLDAEDAWRAAEIRMEQLEAEIREECWQEMEDQIQEERQRWRAERNAAHEQHEAHVDAKLEILSRGLATLDVCEDKENEAPEDQAELIKQANVTREAGLASPTKGGRGLRTTDVSRTSAANARTLRSSRQLD